MFTPNKLAAETIIIIGLSEAAYDRVTVRPSVCKKP